MKSTQEYATAGVDSIPRGNAFWIMKYGILLFLVGLLLSAVSVANDLVILDIGHSVQSPGAVSPDGKLNECAFWYRYAGEVKREIEGAGYRCIVCNRSSAPMREPLATYAKQIGVVQLNKPDTGVRYPSKYFPDRIGAGMVSADFGVEKKPACMVFLHLNSTSGWLKAPVPGLIIHNRVHGKALGDALQQAFNQELFEHPGGVSNGGKGCRTIIRYRKEETASGWLNALDDAGIPAAVIEALYVNNRTHVAYLLTDVGGKKAAQAVAHGIINWLKTQVNQ